MVAAGLTLVASFVVLVVGLAAGTLAFGWHPVTTPTLTVVTQGSAFGRLVLSTLYVAWSQAAYLAFAFMLSTMTDSAFGAVAGGVGLGVVSQILNNISALNGTSYVYPTHYLNAWQGLFFQALHRLRCFEECSYRCHMWSCSWASGGGGSAARTSSANRHTSVPLGSLL